MTNWHTTVCETNEITIHYIRTGRSKPPVILLHGLMTNGLCWAGLAQALEEEYDVIMPEDMASQVYRTIDTDTKTTQTILSV